IAPERQKRSPGFVLYVCAGIQKHSNDVVVAAVSSVRKRRTSVYIDGVDVHLSGKEPSHLIHVSFGSEEHERTRAPATLCVRVGSGSKLDFDLGCNPL